jgi:hypothetical protein
MKERKVFRFVLFRLFLFSCFRDSLFLSLLRQQVSQQRALADVIAFMLGDVADGPSVGDGSTAGPFDDPAKIFGGQFTEP